MAASLTEDSRYRLLVEAVTDYAIFMLDPNGIVRSWNAGARRVKGYEPHEIIGQHFSRFYTEQDRKAGIPERALRTAAVEGRFEAEGWRVRKDGTRFWADVVIDPVFSPSGQILGYSKVTRDLTERRAAEEALRRSEERFRLLVQGVTDYAIYLLDKEGRITDWNMGAERIKGYLPHEILGQHFSVFYIEEDRIAGKPAKALATAAEVGRFESEGWRIRKDGTRFWAHAVLDAVRDPRGELVGFAKITRDVTQQRAAREALLQSQKMEAIGQLTGGVAHDFNNLLAAILGSLTIARNRMTEDPRVLPLINNAIKAAERGATLTKRMLAFARKQELAPQAVGVAELVCALEELLQRTLGPSIVIENNFAEELDPVEVDANQLELSVLNLAVNARDAMPDGGTLKISAAAEEIAVGHVSGLPPGRYVRMTIGDTGEGMDEATLRQATEPFFTTKGVGKGTGLGLSMVHGFAEQSGGRLQLTSVPGAGTTATIWLPAIIRSEARPGASTPLQIVEAPRRLRVLAVDDDALVLMNTVAMLEDLGHEVFEANSGQQALDLLGREEKMDVVVTDQAMPKMSGSELAEKIHETWPDMRIVLATGYSELPPGANGALARLGKPFTEHQLANILTAAAG